MMKCLIYDGGGQILGRYSEPITILRPETNRVEIDPHQLWLQFQICFRKALADAKVSTFGVCLSVSVCVTLVSICVCPCV